MGEHERDRSPELDQVRRLLFPRLPAEDGWARIEGALARASDPARVEAVERLATGDLDGELTTVLRRLGEPR